MSPEESGSEPVFAHVVSEPEERATVTIEGRGGTVLLDGSIESAEIAAIAVALAKAPVMVSLAGQRI